jgi:hypothetical protein
VLEQCQQAMTTAFGLDLEDRAEDAPPPDPEPAALDLDTPVARPLQPIELETSPTYRAPPEWV